MIPKSICGGKIMIAKGTLAARILSVMICLILLLTFAACGKKHSSFEVVSAIDRSSVTEENGITTFTATDKKGRSIRLQGRGVSVTDDGLVMQQGATLYSLDYIGQIYDITIEADLKDAVNYEVYFGIGYADSSSLDGITALAGSTVLSGGIDTPADVSKFNTGFLVLEISVDNPSAFTANKLTITFDDSVPQLYASDIDPASEAAAYLGVFSENMPEDTPEDIVDEEYSFGSAQEELLAQKLEDPNTIMSDIIAGIDHGSIVEDGDTTFFSSVMSDGAVVRFEGYHIDISEEGITIHPDSKLTSLDALGKIYGYYPTVVNYESYPLNEALIDWGYGYTYSTSKTSVDRAYEVHTYSMSCLDAPFCNGEIVMSTVVFEPNFVYISGNILNSTQSFVVSSLEAYYDPTEKVTAMREARMDIDFTGSYLPGEIYDSSNEELEDPYELNLYYYLIVAPDTELAQMEDNSGSIWCLPSAFYEVGEMHDENGNVVDKSTPLDLGYTLDLTIGDFTIPLELPFIEQYEGAYTMHDLVPYAYPAALGQMDTLVVPVIWADQTEMANEDTLNFFRKSLGRVVDAKGTVTDHSVTDDEKFSLSEYYDLASYGKMTITSFITDWYYSDRNFADVWTEYPDDAYTSDISDWLLDTYPDMDWSKYDKDGNGYIDSILILNAGVMESKDVFYMGTYSYGMNFLSTYYGDLAGTQDAPRINVYTSIGYDMLEMGTDVLIHEFAHGLGLIDYYDVTYSGIDAVGSLDMQSANAGDWNCYSKMAVGWMEPTVVEGLASGESVEYTIGASSLADDVIIIPAAGTQYGGPFGEYVMIDLLTMDGANEFGTELFGLDGVQGIRISHVNAAMEKRTMEIESQINPGISAEYTIGTIHYGNDYKDAERAKYNIEVIQAGGTNTFTDPKSDDNKLAADDLFYVGDTFSVEDYDEFFYNGLMDDGSEFGYIIEVVSIGTDANGALQATIRITAK